MNAKCFILLLCSITMRTLSLKPSKYWTQLVKPLTVLWLTLIWTQLVKPLTVLWLTLIWTQLVKPLKVLWLTLIWTQLVKPLKVLWLTLIWTLLRVHKLISHLSSGMLNWPIVEHWITLAWITCPCHYIIGLLCAEYAGYQTMDNIIRNRIYTKDYW